MRKTLVVLCFAAGIVSCQGAWAFPADPTAMKEIARAASTEQQVQYSERVRRYHISKCYREFVVGSYVCHSYRHW